MIKLDVFGWNSTYLGADVDAIACCLICCCGCCGDIERAVDDDLIMAFAWFKVYRSNRKQNAFDNIAFGNGK